MFGPPPMPDVPAVRGKADVQERLVQLVDAYCQRVYPAVLGLHDGGSVSSPLGIWLLLAACGHAATGADRTNLELSLGCSVGEAQKLLEAFVAETPSALHAQLAVWGSAGVDDSAFRRWYRCLPSGIDVGGMPSQAQADEWAQRHTGGLVQRFPARLEDALLVLASVVAADVTWSRPFEVVARRDLFPSSRWLDGVERLLSDGDPTPHTMLATTRAAGVVAVHLAVAVDGLAVLSVSAAPSVPREAVLMATHEVASLVRGVRSPAAKCSLFDLPVGSGHSWQITQRKIATQVAREHVERIGAVTLPAWRVENELDLTRSDLFGAPSVLSALLGLLSPNQEAVAMAATQTAVASYTRSGFQAAAITAFVAFSGISRPAQRRGVERVADLRFDHPHSAIALAGSADSFLGHAAPSPWFGLPLFTAWIDQAAEVNDPAATSERKAAP